MKEINKKFWERLETFLSPQEIETVKNGLNIEKRKVSFRINTLKSNTQEIENTLTQNNISFSKVGNIPNAYILTSGKEKDLWDLDIFQEGKIYLQSLSSQIPVLFFDLQENQKILDVTAAPGSKTSQIAARVKNTGEIYANDNNAIRIDKLKFTLSRQGVTNTHVIKNDATQLSKMFQNETFDHVLADLPCSAEGRIQLNKEKSFGFWSEENIQKNAKLQKEILRNIIPLLKKGGTLVYSTCTLAPEENEEIVDYILSYFPEISLFPINFQGKNIKSGIQSYMGKKYSSEVGGTIRYLPNSEYEGFFIAKFIKK